MFLTHRFTASLQARLLRTAVTGLSIISIGAIAPSPVLSGAAKPDQALQQAAKTGSMPRPNAAITQARAVLEDAHLKANAWVDEGDGAETQEVVEEIKRGDTLNVVLARAGVPAPQAAEAVSALRKVYNPRDLKPGQQVRLVLANAPTPGTPDQMVKLHLQPSVERDVMVEASAAGAFEAREVVKPLKVELTRGGGTIDLSLFQTGINNGVPVDVMLEMIRTFSYDVDFQRDIQPGDGFDILYEQKVTEDGKVARVGHMLYASMSLSGQVLKLYRYEDGSGFVDFYTPKGESVRKALLKTPIDGAKLTSGFGMRRHPILGFSLMHKGIDFGAPTGTPIMAAGDGVVAKAGPNGAYGNYIQIRHNTQYATAYAHLDRFASGMREGTRVRQGQVIGFVGTTGRSTGPHLHYEVMMAGQQVNPLSVKLPTGRSLDGKELQRFRQEIQEIDRKLRDLPDPQSVATRD